MDVGPQRFPKEGVGGNNSRVLVNASHGGGDLGIASAKKPGLEECSGGDTGMRNSGSTRPVEGERERWGSGCDAVLSNDSDFLVLDIPG